MKPNLYPLQFEPILKERIWGGEKLKTVLNKPITSKITGESWELSTVEGDVSVVADGVLKGHSLTDLIDQSPNEILGTKVYERFGKQFPLLFKYLDAREDLSIQVHPNDKLAKERHNSFGKTEMWYVMQADDDARLIVGFKEKSSPEEYIQHLENKTLLNILDTKKVKKGDNTKEVITDILIEVKILGIKVHTYKSYGVETYKGDELIEFKSKTQDGSDNDYCNIKKISDGKYSFDGMTENKKYVYELSDKFYPALWWNHESLLNNNYVLGQGCRNLKTQITFLKKETKKINEKKPNNIIFNVETIDNRLPNLEDGASWPILLKNYELINSDQSYILLKNKININNKTHYFQARHRSAQPFIPRR